MQLAKDKDWVTIALLLVSLILTVYFSSYLYKKEIRNTELILETDLQKYAATVEVETERTLTLLSTLKSFLSVSRIRRQEFYTIADDALANYQQLQSVAWVPYVPHQFRRQYEQLLQKYTPGFQFTRRQGDGFVRSEDSEFYLPMYYFRSKTENPFIHGLNLLTEQDVFSRQLMELINQESDSEFIVNMTPSNLNLLNTKQEIEHYLTVIMPVYNSIQNSDFPIRGFLIGEIKVEELLQFFLEDDQHQYIDLIVADVTSKKEVIYLILSEPIDGKVPLDQHEYSIEKNSIGGRQWKFTATPTARYMSFFSTYQWVIALIIGLVLNLLLAAYIYSLRSRNLTVNALVSTKTQQLEQVNRQLEKLSRTDALTGLANRRYFDEFLENEWNRARRDKRPLSLIICDIDYFKNYNDRNGHVEGDQCLRQVALALKKCFNRSGDLVSRYGGEEFAVILPSTELSTELLMEKCLKDIENLQISHGDSLVSKYVSISLGGCTIVPSDKLEIAHIINTADKALYQAKMGGRNKGVIFDFNKRAIKNEAFGKVIE